jgi:hypothetical protein
LLLVLSLGAALTGCSPEERAFEFRPRVPALVTLEYVGRDGVPRPALGPGEVRPGVPLGASGWSAASATGCPWRDEQGFPHLCKAARYLVTDDGRLRVVGEVGMDGDLLRIRFGIRYYGWCRRALGRCWQTVGYMDVTTPWTNVAAFRVGRPAEFAASESADDPR